MTRVAEFDFTEAGLQNLPVTLLQAMLDGDVPVGTGGGGAGTNVKTYGATGDGVTDDTAACEAALAACLEGESADRTVYFPPGTYLLSSMAINDSNVTIVGDRATIVFDSLSEYAFQFGADVSRVKVQGIKFIGTENDDYTVNLYAALYFLSGATDIDIIGCTFNECQPLTVGSNDSTTGRLLFTGNRVFEAPLGISTPSRSIIAYNWFINDAVVDTRSHMVYLFGPAEGCFIFCNFFKNGANQDIQIRAGSARYQQKKRFVIANNHFENSGQSSMWLGSDDTTNTGEFIVVGNTGRNVSGFISAQGLRDSLITGNSASWDWEYSGARSSFSSAISVIHGGTSLVGHINPASSVMVSNNNLIMRHPAFGKITFLAIPSPGDTMTIGSQTYTWQVGPEAGGGTGQVQIQATIIECISRLAEEVRGRGWDNTRQNAVLREETDCFFNTYTTSGGPANELIIASATTFTLSRSNAVNASVTAPIDNREACNYPIVVVAAHHPVVMGNTCTDFGKQISVENSISPTVRNNTMIGCSITGRANVFSIYEGNRFIRTPASDAALLYPYRYLSTDDGFAVLKDNGLTCEQEYNTLELGGYSGVVTAGDGKARTFLYYGEETFYAFFTEEPQSIPFRWSDGDTVVLDNGAGTVNTFTFKRTAPGALQFNSYSSLKTLINATGTYTASNAAFYDAGGTPDPQMMLEIKCVAVGTAGNNCTLTVNTRAKTCGQVLANRRALESYARFYGGAATAVKTVIFSPIASTQAPLSLQGVDSAAQALGPIVYKADITPGVCWVATHTAAAGQQFFFKAGAN